MSGGGSGREALIAAMRGPEYREPPRIDDPVALAFARRLAARGIVAVPGAEDERERTRKVLQYLKDSRILEQLEAERKAAAEPPPPPPTTATLVRKVLEQEAEAINKEEARKAAQASNVIPQPSSSDPAASVPLNGVAVLRRALAGGGGTINGQ